MRRQLPPLNPLRAFEAAARNRSLSKAADELSVTHGAVSHQVKALEASMGVALFRRDGRQLALTEHGAELLPAVTSAFDTIAAATARMTRPTTSGRLSIACVPALMSFWLIPRLTGFTARFPEVRLTLRASNDQAAIHDPSIDVAILYGDGNWPDCWATLWTRFNLFPVLSPPAINAHPLRSVRDIGKHRILHADDDGQEWRNWLTAADALDLEQGRHDFMGDARMATEAALAGHGVALGDSLTAANLLRTGQLVAPLNLTVPARHAFFVACRSDLRAAPIVDVFINWLFGQLDEDGARVEPQHTARRALLKSPHSRTGSIRAKPAKGKTRKRA